jgi:hypothetical protein
LTFTLNHFVLATRSLRLTISNFFQLNTCFHNPWICPSHLLLVLASAINLRSESRGTRDHILLSQIRHSLNLEGQVPVFLSPRNRVAQLYPQAPGSLFVASYDSQGYGGGIRSRLHTGSNSSCVRSSLYSLWATPTENTASPIVVC